jgi:hypothetical protein
MRRHTITALATLVLAAGATALWAQAQVPDTGSLAALTAEIRQLRVAVEESGRTQGQTQALAIYISAQRDRMIQMSARFDAGQKELDAVSMQTRGMAEGVAAVQRETTDTNLDAVQRRRATEQLAALRGEYAQRTAREQELRARLLELQQAIHGEEARWGQLIAQLEQAIRR